MLKTSVRENPERDAIISALAESLYEYANMEESRSIWERHEPVGGVDRRII